jgi:hypothetical protein
MASYTTVFPTAHDDTYVKATSKASTDYWPYYSTDPAKTVTGAASGNSWLSNATTNQRFHIDLGAGKIIRRIYYENYHASGGDSQYGAKTFTFWGSNTAAAFADLTYATDTNWTQIGSGVFDQHVALDQADPKYILITNTVDYRYYAVKIAVAYADVLIAWRRIQLQTEDGFSTGSKTNSSFLMNFL